MDLLFKAINTIEHESLQGPSPPKILKTDNNLKDPFPCQPKHYQSNCSNSQNLNNCEYKTISANELLKNYLMDQICVKKLWTFVLVQIEYSLASSDTFMKTENTLNNLIQPLKEMETVAFLNLFGKCLIEKFGNTEIIRSNIARETVIKSMPQKVTVKPSVSHETRETIIQHILPPFDSVVNSDTPVVPVPVVQDPNENLLQSVVNSKEPNTEWTFTVQSDKSLNPNEFSEPDILIPHSAPVIEEQQLMGVMGECFDVNQATTSTSTVDKKGLITQEIIDEIRSEMAVSKLFFEKEPAFKKLIRAWTKQLFVRLFTKNEINNGNISGRTISGYQKYDAIKVHSIMQFLAWLKSNPKRFDLHEYRKYVSLIEAGSKPGLSECDKDHFRKVIQQHSHYLRSRK